MKKNIYKLNLSTMANFFNIFYLIHIPTSYLHFFGYYFRRGVNHYSMLIVLMVSLIHSIFSKDSQNVSHVNMRISIILVLFVLFPQHEMKALYLADLAAGSAP